MPTLRLLPVEYWRNLRAGVQIEPRDQLLEIGLIDAAAQVSEVFKDLPACQIGIESEFARQIADQPLDLYRLPPAIQAGDARRTRVGAQQRHQQANRRRLAGAVGAEKAEDFAFLHLERDVL